MEIVPKNKSLPPLPTASSTVQPALFASQKNALSTSRPLPKLSVELPFARDGKDQGDLRSSVDKESKSFVDFVASAHIGILCMFADECDCSTLTVDRSMSPGHRDWPDHSGKSSCRRQLPHLPADASRTKVVVSRQWKHFGLARSCLASAATPAGKWFCCRQNRKSA